MSVLDVSKVRIEGKAGPFGIAQLRGESLPATFSMDDSIADPYRLDPVKLTESHASALDFVTATRARELMGIMRQGLDSSIDGPVLPGRIAGGRRIFSAGQSPAQDIDDPRVSSGACHCS